jgi:hypothetical protein
MPFDDPHQTPFGDLELLMEARGRISRREAWVPRGFCEGWHGNFALGQGTCLICIAKEPGSSLGL